MYLTYGVAMDFPEYILQLDINNMIILGGFDHNLNKSNLMSDVIVTISFYTLVKRCRYSALIEWWLFLLKQIDFLN